MAATFKTSLGHMTWRGREVVQRLLLMFTGTTSKRSFKSPRYIIVEGEAVMYVHLSVNLSRRPKAKHFPKKKKKKRRRRRREKKRA